MTFAITVVHAPGALPADRWAQLRSRAPGAYAHELRLRLNQSSDSVPGSALQEALGRFLGTGSVQLSTAGVPLHSVAAGSALMHPGMVVLAAPTAHQLQPVRLAQLSLCVDSGPDAGRLIPLRRGQHSIGRSRAQVQIADPAVSRRAAVLEVGARQICLHPHTREAATPFTVDSGITLGATALSLSLDPPQSAQDPSWPPPAEPIGEKAPEGKHSMMLAFALVPLLAGIVLVLVTGMWMFLMFSGASALIAAAVFADAQRRRRRFRRALRRAAGAWAERATAALCTPGELIRQLRSPQGRSIHAGGTADSGPAVRIGAGKVSAQLDFASSTEPAKKYDDDAEVLSTAGITLTPGEQTRICGPLREAQRLLRWVLVQLVLSPGRPRIVLLSSRSNPELRDLPQVSPWHPERPAPLPDSESDHRSSPGVLVCIEPAQTDLVQQALNAGWHVLTPTAEAGQNPGWTVDLADRTVLRHSGAARPETSARQLRFDGLSTETLAEHLRLSLPHVAVSSTAGQVPQQCSYPLPEHLFGDTAAERLDAVLGQSAQGQQALDLVSEGPHLLIGGTTGSGKSELLKTLLVSLCANYGPSELGLVLIDFKGGAAFHQLSTLEHTLGVVTDLSQAAAERTLEGIRSELIRRERLFLEAGAGDYAEYRSMQPQQPLARILVVIDEFRIFSHELPDQLDELMRLATLGRSLGLHLVLSTQRPQGVVTADIRANIGASICLRVRSEEESQDVIGGPEAASIPRNLPGRAVLRRPGDPPVLFQTAQLIGSHRLQLQPESQFVPEPIGSEFRTVVEALQRASVTARHRRSHTPLLPRLPETMSCADWLEPSGNSSILLGRLDDPAGQRQEDLILDLLRPRSLALLGESGSGAAGTVGAAAEQALNTVLDADVYLLDGDRSLVRLASHPRVGAWLTDEHMPEVEHLLEALHDEMLARRMREGRHRPVLLAVTGYAQWQAAGQHGAQLMEHLLGTLAAEGPQAGPSVLIAGGRELAMGRLSARIPARVYLPLGTSEEVRYLWPTLRSTDPLPGRGVFTDSKTPPPGLVVQLVTESTAAEPSLGRTVDTEPPHIRVRPLPERLTVTELPPTEPPAEGQPPAPVVGVQQFSWNPATLPLGPVNLILGGRATGKSSCLRLLAQQLPGAFLLTPGAAGPQTKPGVLLVDDAVSCSAEQHDLIQQAVTAGVPVVATAAATSAVFSRLPWAHPARSEGSNLLLSPTSRSQGDAFATLVPVMPRPIPGRAVHLRPEGSTLVQWALPG